MLCYTLHACRRLMSSAALADDTFFSILLCRVPLPLSPVTGSHFGSPYHADETNQVIHWAIVSNVVVIGMGGHNIGEKKADVLSDLEAVLTIFFTVEAALKITVLGAGRYFKSRCVKETTTLLLRELDKLKVCKHEIRARKNLELARYFLCPILGA